ncbi:enoyl-CoA hydratase/isomerase family protein [Paracoccus sp. IB05]|uniref:enoyl-CoA hydratase/isomerase family protein n=1 Tax=Paracoccus sp. IB05 TaxID=2779367 RepID=UPI0018E8C728|nr:enoyl-CoA hydratase/isomerase family protein [Paracoccus sp. IB05]MBJ2151329.1 enoyl-CoA hydratase/isomerase family protein [Paracoccus sp. IB05]
MSAVHLTLNGPLAEIRLDNPAKLNCFTADMLAQFATHLDVIEHSEARVVLVTATPGKCFCSGADITGWGALSPRDFARHWVRGGHRLFDRLARLAQPTIAVMEGHAFGGGLELAAACDIRVMAPGATIALPETGIGIVPGWSGTQRLARLLPEPVLREMSLFGRRIAAERAHNLGFIAEIAHDPRATALEIAARAVTLSPRATEVAKQMILAGRGEDKGALIEALGSAAIAASEDRSEGVASFAEKRKPIFSGQ